MALEWKRDWFLISTDPGLIDIGVVHRFLSEDSYWSKGIPVEVVQRGLANSMVFGVYDTALARAGGGHTQIGLARVISDRATYAYLADVFVVASYRGRGLSKWLMEVITGHPELQGLRRWMLMTLDAQGLYRQYGFTEAANPERVMERVDRDVYRKKA